MKLRRLSMVILVCAATAAAEEPLRPVASAWMAEVGTSHLADTYLSPLKYTGMRYALTYSRLQAMKRPTLVQGWDAGIAIDCCTNPAGNATMTGATIDGSWRIMRRWSIGKGFGVGVGGYAGLQAGALYLSRNGNNPAQAIGNIAIGPEAFAQWSGSIGKLPIAVRWQASTPMTGAFFCPDYGELYYEIAIGNRSDLVHFAWPGNSRRLRSLLSVDLNFGHHTLRLGYRFDATSTRANNITSRRISHAAVVGIVCDFVNINPRKQDAQIITAYY